jgi:RNA polymerase sigma factor (sigma-70 family)
MDIDAAIEKTYKEHINLFLSIAHYNYGLDPETGMDRVHEAFVKIWSNRHRIKNQREAGIRNFALKVFRNTCIDHLRRKRLASPPPPDTNPITYKKIPHQLEAVVDRSSDPLNEMLLIEELRLQSTALDKIPANYRETVRMSLQGLKPREIALRLKVKSSTLKNLKHRGLKLFQKKLREMDPDRMSTWKNV